MNKDVRLVDYVGHIITAIDKIKIYTAVGKDEFYASELIQDAVMRNLEIVGEASSIIKRNYPDVVSSNPHIPFRSATEMRNVLSHAYFSVDVDILWNTISNDLDGLRTQLQELLVEISGSS